MVMKSKAISYSQMKLITYTPLGVEITALIC